MVSSSLAWQLFLGIVSVAQMAVLVLGSVLLGAYVATLWQAARDFRSPHAITIRLVAYKPHP